MSDMKIPTAAITLPSQYDKFEVKMPSGRIFKYEKIKHSQRMKLFLAMGAEAVQNPVYLSYILIGAGIRSIDGVPMPFPLNADDLDAMNDELGDDADEFMAEWQKRQPTDEGDQLKN